MKLSALLMWIFVYFRGCSQHESFHAYTVLIEPIPRSRSSGFLSHDSRRAFPAAAVMNWLAGFLAIALLAYLLYALIRPERF
jgi:K+-transporting ATPase KdpF subunit